MIEFLKGDILESQTQAIINTVNTFGVSGKGLALQVKQKYPNNHKAYKRYCDKKLLKPGELFVFERDMSENPPQYIINFATKDDWRFPSKLEWIEKGLELLKNLIITLNIDSLSLPALGCQNGKLLFSDVKALIIKKLHNIDELCKTHILIFEPH